MKKHYIVSIILICSPFIVLGQINPEVNPGNFSFAVVGDRTGTADQPIFEQVIATVKTLNPDFVINVGDLIEGYTDNVDTLNSEWNEIFSNLGDLKSKFYFTPGNHDALDSLSLAVYLSRVGYQKSYYSFSIGKNHFIVLDNSRQEKIDKFDSSQVQWLNTELSKHKKSDNVFCFMHRSYWKDAYTNNKPDTFHKLFVKYGVDYVFSGHDHFYCQLIWDGITYTQVGPSGSRLKVYDNEAYGAFQNFMMVVVKNNKVQLKLFRPDGTELAPDYVTFNDIKELQNIEKAIEITPLNIEKSDSISVTVKNISNVPLITTLLWDIDNTNWYFIPKTSPLNLQVKESETKKFKSVVNQDNIYPLPRLTLTYPYANGKKIFNLKRRMPIHLTAECHRSKRTVNIDGKLTEKIWSAVKPIYIFGSGDGDISQTDPWEVIFTYDNNNLYIGAKITDSKPSEMSAQVLQRDDNKIYQDDNLNIILQPRVDSDTYYQFFINPKGAVLDRICYLDGKSNKRDVKWNSEINVKTQILTGNKFNGWTLEALLPLKQFYVTKPSDWGFNLVRYQKRTDKVSIYSIPFEHNPKTFALLNFEK